MPRKTVTFELDGGKDLVRKLRKLGKKAFDDLSDIVEDASKPLVQEAKARVPVDRGTLRDSIHASRAFAKRGTVEYHVGPSAKGFYGRFVEYGTRFQPKRPFLRPAADAKESIITKMLADGLHKTLSSEDE